MGNWLTFKLQVPFMTNTQRLFLYNNSDSNSNFNSNNNNSNSGNK